MSDLYLEEQQRKFNVDLERAQIAQLEAETAQTQARTIDTQVNSIATLLRATQQYSEAPKPSKIIEAVVASDLSLLLGAPIESDSKILIP